jgi:hypothetical protein
MIPFAQELDFTFPGIDFETLGIMNTWDKWGKQAFARISKKSVSR